MFALFVMFTNPMLLLKASKGYWSLLVCDCVFYFCLCFPRLVQGSFLHYVPRGVLIELDYTHVATCPPRFQKFLGADGIFNGRTVVTCGLQGWYGEIREVEGRLEVPPWNSCWWEKSCSGTWNTTEIWHWSQNWGSLDYMLGIQKICCYLTSRRGYVKCE